MEQNQFKCSGDCLNCRMNPVERKTQWQYCSAQFTYNTMRMIETMQQSLTAMQGTVTELAIKIEAIQNSEANVLNPTHEEKSETPNLHGLSEMPTNHPIAQSGDGAESRSPETN